MSPSIAKHLNKDSLSGLVLVAAALAAILVYNSPFSGWYDAFLNQPFVLGVGDAVLEKTVLLIINDGLMAIFFLYVGLEIKYEILKGNLSTPKNALLPAAAAFGGMAVPAAIYALLNMGDSMALNGWAIPAATDIAFALGVLAILGPRVPPALKVFLLTLAILDDLGAIIVIAAFYTADLSLMSLGLAGAGILVLVAFNLLGVTRITPYMIIGAFIWLAVLKSGVHATLAGVAVALTIPLRSENYFNLSPLKALEHSLSPWVAFAIMPVFAFANAGVSLQGFSLSSLLSPIPLGIAAGLFIGKQLGVFGAVFALVKLGFASLPTGVSFRQVYGAALLAGIGFTMSLFIGSLAFVDPAYQSAVRFGVLTGSILSAALGYSILKLSLRTSAESPEQQQQAAQ